MLTPEAAEFFESMYRDFASLDPAAKPTSIGNLIEEYRERARITGADGAKPQAVAQATLNYGGSVEAAVLEGHAGEPE
jgi:hypothetical protein